MVAVAIILAADAVAVLLIGTFLFRGRARGRVAANGPPDATINQVSLTAPAPVASVAVADPFVAVIPEPVALRPESVEATSGLLEVIPPAPAPRPSSPAQVSVPPTDGVASDATPADTPEPTVIAADGLPPGAGRRPRTVSSRHLLLTVGTGLVLGAVLLARRR